MNITITGSLGHIGKPLTEGLIQKEHAVTVVSSNPEKQKDIEALGAKAAIGSVTDAAFLAAAFTGADAVFCMIPPNYAEPDPIAYYSNVGSSYAEAIRQSGVKRVVELSSYGAHLEKGTGLIVGSYHVEQILNELTGVDVTHIRPGYFYYNLLSFIPLIRTAGFIGANYGGEDKLILVSPKDIAAAVADELLKPLDDNKIRYVASDDRTCSEVAGVLGRAIGKPDLKWITMTNEQTQSGLETNGMPAYLAVKLVELGAAIHSGILREDLDRNMPVMGEVKLEDYAAEFAAAYHA